MEIKEIEEKEQPVEQDNNDEDSADDIVIVDGEDKGKVELVNQVESHINEI